MSAGDPHSLPAAPPPDPQPPRAGSARSGKSRLSRNLLLIGLLIGAFALYLAFRKQGAAFDWWKFAATFRQMDLGWFAAAVAMVMLTYVGRAVRWQVMIRPMRPDSKLWGLFTATVIGFTAVVLFGRPGEFVRPYLIATRERVSFTSQLAAWLLERIYDLLSVLLLFGFALTRISSSSTQLGGTMQWILATGGQLAGVLATVCLAVLVVFGLFPGFVERQLVGALQVLPERYRGKVTGLVRAFLAGTSSTQRGRFVFLLVLYTFCEWLIIVGCFVCVFRAFPATSQLGFLDALLVVGFVAFGSAVQIPGIGGGMQVSTVLVLTEMFQLPLETATGIAILLWFVAFAIVVPAGLALAIHEGLSFRKLMQDREIQSA